MDFPLIIDNSGLGAIALTGTPADQLITNAYLSLTIERGTFFAAPDFGLRRRPRLKNNPATARLIEADARDALQWLLDTGRASAITVASQRDQLQDPYRLKLLVTITRASGRLVELQTFVEVV